MTTSSQVDDVARRSLFGNSIHTLIFEPQKHGVCAMTHKVSETPVVDQKSTGTCWLQAALTMLSTRAKTAHDVEVRFSVSYLAYYDKLGKARVYLKRMRDGNLSREWRWHLRQDPVTDGGTWGMFAHLVKTHGLLTHESMRATHQCTHTSQMNGYLNQFLRSIGPSADLDAVDAQVVRMLGLCYGIDPSQLLQNLGEHAGVHPTELLHKVLPGFDLDEYVVLAHSPSRALHSPTTCYFGAYYNDPATPTQDRFMTQDMSVIVERSVAELRNGFAVWITADVRIDFSSRNGIAAVDVLDVGPILGISPHDKRDKALRMENGNTAPVHAMLLTGVQLDETTHQPVAWRLQNSWGKKGVKKGFVEITDEWFRKHVFQVAVHAHESCTCVNPADPIGLTPWDVFSTVAQGF